MTVQEPSNLPEDGAEEDWYGAETTTFGDRLAGAREAAGLSQGDLALKLGVKVSTLRKWEEDLSEPRANRLQMLSGILNVSLRWLLTAEGDGPTEPPPEAQLPGEVKAILKEIREVHSEILRSNERLAVLEKRLRRRILEGAGE